LHYLFADKESEKDQIIGSQEVINMVYCNRIDLNELESLTMEITVIFPNLLNMNLDKPAKSYYSKGELLFIPNWKLGKNLC